MFKKEIEREKILTFGFEQLKSGYASVVSTICEIFDSTYISNNKEKLSNKILVVVNEELNNAGFLEAHQSLLKLAGLIKPEFELEIKSILINSAVSSIRALSGVKPVKNSSTVFESIWNNAFKYKKAVFETDKGSFTLQLFPEYAPISVGNFSTLVQAGFYRDVIFHRVVPGFVIQAGDPTGTGWGGPGYDIISEYSPLEYTTGALGMASAGKDTEGSQFFVMQGTFPHLTSRYTLFGRITDGQKIVDMIPQYSIIKKISLFE
ncbi:MAG: peptidylprolyl isomerase [Ignavibacteriaceae bacterium]|nr:peptidylprolyl isomerase [Ignavibacteriaceae bacterium]